MNFRFVFCGILLLLLVACIFVFSSPAVEQSKDDDAFFLFELPVIKEMQEKAVVARFQFTAEGRNEGGS